MNSPFPGIDPYLEDPDIWTDFHTSFFGELKKDLNQVLPPGYQAKINRHGHEGNRYLKIIDRKRQRVVTVVEILSPSNKNAGMDRDAYLLKRNEYLAAGVNLIELDFLRSGARMPWGEQQPPTASYYVMIARRWQFPHAGVWPLSLRDPLPSIPIPLEQNIAEPLVDLQACFTKVYAGGRYENEIDYSQPPSPALDEPDAAWAVELLKGKT